jgi:hypothetical protein
MSLRPPASNNQAEPLRQSLSKEPRCAWNQLSFLKLRRRFLVHNEISYYFEVL